MNSCTGFFGWMKPLDKLPASWWRNLFSDSFSMSKGSSNISIVGQRFLLSIGLSCYGTPNRREPPCSFGCRSKIGSLNGALASGNMDQNLWFFGGLSLTHTHLYPNTFHLVKTPGKQIKNKIYFQYGNRFPFKPTRGKNRFSKWKVRLPRHHLSPPNTRPAPRRGREVGEPQHPRARGQLGLRT